MVVVELGQLSHAPAMQYELTTKKEKPQKYLLHSKINFQITVSGYP